MKNILFLLIITPFLSISQISYFEKHKFTIEFIEAFRNNNKLKIASFISYPIKMSYPNPPIKSQSEFLKRYDELFDEYIVNLIINSTGKWDINDENSIRFNDGVTILGTMYLFADSRTFIINHITDNEREKLKLIIEREKEGLHFSIKNYLYPCLIMKTKTIQLRIDKLENLGYRLSLWDIKTPMSQKPKKIWLNGEYETRGSCDNIIYIFRNNEFTYEICVNSCGAPGFSPADFVIYEKENIFHSEPSVLLKD